MFKGNLYDIKWNITGLSFELQLLFHVIDSELNDILLKGMVF